MANDIPKDKTGYIIPGLFIIFAAIVTYCIWKGTHPGTVQMEENVLYVKPKAKL